MAKRPLLLPLRREWQLSSQADMREVDAMHPERVRIVSVEEVPECRRFGELKANRNSLIR